MCYLVAKDVNKIGSIAWQTTHGKQLAEFKSGLIKKFGYDRIQFVTISRPSAYGEYMTAQRSLSYADALIKKLKGE